MDALEYLRAKSRMTNNCRRCEKCKLHYKYNSKGKICDAFEREYPKEAIQIVEDWAKENPIVTNKDKFYEVMKGIFGLKEIKSRCTYNLPTIMCSNFPNCIECKKHWDSEYKEINK